jgi:hypothetical protein
LTPGTVLLAAATAVQVVTLAVTIRPLVARIVSYRDLSARTRGVHIAFGEQLGSFVEYLESEVPYDARVVIPPQEIDSTLGNVGLVQYFLFPRDIVNCPAGPDLAECVRSMVGDRTFILRAGEFPEPRDVPSSKTYLPFNTELGLYRPR